MKNILLCIGIIALYLAPAIPAAFAEGEIAGDKQAVRGMSQEIKADASAARQEEKQLRDQIHSAIQAGDMATAKKLKEQLKAMHHENVQEMQQDKQALGEVKKELRHDINEARKEGKLTPRMDKDNNPHGPRGGRGTNWENPRGPKGGPGASPNRKK